MERHLLDHCVAKEVEEQLNALVKVESAFVQDMQQKKASAQQLLIRLVKIYFHTAKCSSLSAYVCQGLKDVPNIRASGKQQANRPFPLIVLEKISCRRESPVLYVSNLIDNLHSNNLKLLLLLCNYMIGRGNKADEVQRIVDTVKEQELEEGEVNRPRGAVHTLRAVIVVIDLTKSINMKDFKPSRLSVVTTMLKFFLRRAKDNTPIIKFALAIVQNQTCKFLSHFTYDLEVLFEELDRLKVSGQAGHFSMQNTLRSCLYEFDSVAGEFHKEVLLIQSSPLTKDVRNIFETIGLVQNARIAINILSMVGWTNVYQKLIDAVKGQYVTVSSGEEFRAMVSTLANPPPFDAESVVLSKLKMGLCKKENMQGERICLCHFQRCRTYYTCNICEATICKDPPVECPVCQTILILPTDLYNHIIIT